MKQTIIWCLAKQLCRKKYTETYYINNPNLLPMLQHSKRLMTVRGAWQITSTPTTAVSSVTIVRSRLQQIFLVGRKYFYFLLFGNGTSLLPAHLILSLGIKIYRIRSWKGLILNAVFSRSSSNFKVVTDGINHSFSLPVTFYLCGLSTN